MLQSEFFAQIQKDELEDCLRECQTPCYVYFGTILNMQLSRIHKCLGDGFEVHYALKANSNSQLLAELAKAGIGADVASGGELKLALAAGFGPEKIEFSGPGKRIEELRLAVDAGVGSINIENLAEIELISDLAQNSGKIASIGIRLNPGAASGKTGMRMSGDTQFGLNIEAAKVALEKIKAHGSFLRFTGYHAHLASQELNARDLVASYKLILDCVHELTASSLMQPSKINFGGGWGITYFEKQSALDLNSFQSGLSELLAEEKYADLLNETRLLVEPGRFISGECGIFAARVLYCKDTETSSFVVLDGGMNANYLLAGGMGQVIQRNFQMDVVQMQSRPLVIARKVNVAGPLCTPQDILARNWSTEYDIQPGDIMVFFNCGAYGPSASPVNFLGQEPPQEYYIGD